MAEAFAFQSLLFLRTAPADEIARVFQEWGEEPFAEPLAQGIVGSRKLDPVESGAVLVSVVERVLKVRDNNHGSHPAPTTYSVTSFCNVAFPPGRGVMSPVRRSLGKSVL